MVDFLSGIGMFTVDFSCSRLGSSEAVSLVASVVDSDFDTEKVCVFPLPVILAESAYSVAFDSFELLLEERLESSAQYGVKVRLVALGEI